MKATAAIRWLIWDTFRQARASGLSLVLLFASLATIGVCLSAEAHGDLHLKPASENDNLELLPANDRDAHFAKWKGGAEVLRNRLTLLGGKIEVPLSRDIADGVRWLHYILASRVAEAFGVLLALIWTAGFLPAFLQPNAVTVLLAKPTNRTTLLLGKSIGVVAFVAIHATFFVVGTWMALGLKTGYWATPYLYSAPMLALQFAAFFGFSLLLATVFRSSVVCVVGSILCWLVCFGVNSGRHALASAPMLQAEEQAAKKALATKMAEQSLKSVKPRPFDPEEIPAGDPAIEKERSKNRKVEKPTKWEELRTSERMEPAGEAQELTADSAAFYILNACYWALPKPLDFSYMVFDNVGASELVEPPPYYRTMVQSRSIDLRWATATSFLFALALFAASAHQFSRDDY